MDIKWAIDAFEQLPFQLLDYTVISLNLLIFLTAGFIIRAKTNYRLEIEY